MKTKVNLMIFLLLLVSNIIFGSDKKVLVEIFTNSHCPLCPSAHSALDSYLSSENGEKITYIYYHMQFPYSSDKLYQDNTSDAAAINSFYGPYSSSPQAFFGGEHVSNSYSSWSGQLNNLVAEESSFEISLTREYTESIFAINAEIYKTSEFSESDLTINFVVVEDVTYQGNNGITNHKNVMRQIANVEGEEFSINMGEKLTKSYSFQLNESWNSSNISVVAFIRDKSSNEVYQSESIDYSNFTLTDIQDMNELSNDFRLYQNYPNPFNPTTKIQYTIPNFSNNNVTQIKIYDILGKEIKTLVDQKQSAGTYEISFNASELPSGIYYYQLINGNFIQTKKMTLLK